MKTLATLLENKFRQAFDLVGIPSDTSILLTEATKEEFGDYQVNGAMAAAKALRKNPRELAQQIIDIIDKGDIITKLELAGPGFINITLADNYLGNYVRELSVKNKFGAQLLEDEQQTVIIDYSSPNLAKEMHVGHLRSTVIGDALTNILAYMGDKVIRQNHVGDWGTQFGMLIAYMIDNKDDSNFEHKISDLEDFYRKAKVCFDESEEFKAKARQYVVILQNWQNFGFDGEQVYNYWKSLTSASLTYCQSIYDKLGVSLTINDAAPESMYNDRLDEVIKTLSNKHLLQDSDGAKCVFFADGELPGSESSPFIVQKQDGGFLYSTTDLAAIDYRTHILRGNRLLYVVDNRQALHFKQVFNVAKKAGFADADTKLEHIAFGTMMNEDGKPFKTRSGGTIKLADLINEAITRADQLLEERDTTRDGIDKTELAKKLAIASIKYADLSKSRISDYIFSFDKMLAFDGNTAPYLLYANTRIQSLLKKAYTDFGYELNDSSNYTVIITNALEHKLSLSLAKFADTILLTAKECYPHYLCQYLYNLAGVFMQFYEACPILKETNQDLIHSRLTIVKKVSDIIQVGLNLLGIETVEKM